MRPACHIPAIIIDCHVHLNNYHEDQQLSLDQSLDRLQREMSDSGVSDALVLTSYLVSPNRPSTAEVVKVIEKYRSAASWHAP